MGKDLNLINEVWTAALGYRNLTQSGLASSDCDVALDYYTALCVASALLEDSRLAQRLVDQTWDEDAESEEPLSPK